MKKLNPIRLRGQSLPVAIQRDLGATVDGEDESNGGVLLKAVDAQDDRLLRVLAAHGHHHNHVAVVLLLIALQLDGLLVGSMAETEALNHQCLLGLHQWHCHCPHQHLS